MIPDFDKNGRLPPGLHPASWDEVAARFGTTPHRRRLLAGLLRALQNLKQAGCYLAYLDGSFVTNAPVPGDFDGCWEGTGVDLRRVDRVLLTFDPGRVAQKTKYLGELFPARATADAAARTFLEFFQVDKYTGDAKGIVALSLDGLPK